MKKTTILLFSFFLLNSLPADAQQTSGTFTNPVIRGDMADPTIVRIGDTYYASGTSSEWAPFYPMFVSKDLVNWTQTGHIFEKQPEWTSSSFWAPELFHYKNKLYAYYTARNKKGVSYIGVATTDDPAKPFTDHGLVVEYGTEAIDAFILEDKGELYISWKAYGLDQRPIELLACKLSDDGLRLAGEPFSLLKDDERIGMEGQHWFKDRGYYYMIYSVRGCCGPGSDYQVYVARSKELKGPYEKYDGNPILAGDGENVLSCGHGTVTITPENRMYYLYHAYLAGDRFFNGRQVMLQELYVGDDDWVHFTTGNHASLVQKLPYPERPQSIVSGFEDTFDESVLPLQWTWNYPYSDLKAHTEHDVLVLSGTPKAGNISGTALCLRPVSPQYVYETQVTNRNGSLKGLTMYGDDKNLIAFGTVDSQLVLKEIRDGKETILCQIPLSGISPYLRIEVSNGTMLRFFWSDGRTWTEVFEAFDSTPFVRWDRVSRPGLIHIGKEKESARFSYFKMDSI